MGCIESKNDICAFCNNQIFKNELRCVRCNIKLHYNCYEKTSESEFYTKCINCNRIGSIGYLNSKENQQYYAHFSLCKEISSTH